MQLLSVMCMCLSCVFFSLYTDYVLGIWEKCSEYLIDFFSLVLENQVLGTRSL